MNAETERVWSEYQWNIFDHVDNPEGGNALVKAVAGSGKSTTLVQCSARIKGSYIMLAFNKSIAEELKSKGVNARTFHSLCYSPVTRARGTDGVESNKLFILCKSGLNSEDNFKYRAFVCKLVSIARQMGIGCLITDAESHWHAIVEHHGMELENDGANMPRAIEIARWLFSESNSSSLVDFDDLLYFAVKDGISLQKYDFVMVDEYQDTNMIQQAILRKIMHPTSRLLAVGDDFQAIYGFRGADSESFNRAAEEFNAKVLPLSICYRCAKSIVKYAQQWQPDIQAAPDAPDGVVTDLGVDWDIKMFLPTDLVLCRTTKPLVALAYKMLKARMPVKILGREIGQSLITVIKQMKTNDVDELILKIEAWREREVEKATAKGLESKVEAIKDKGDAIITLIDTLEEDDRSVNALIDVVDKLFSNTENATSLSTIHKAKGMENDRVFWLNRSQCPAKWAKRDWQKQQERNLCYVATTRAMTTLIFIEDGSGVKRNQLQGDEIGSWHPEDKPLKQDTQVQEIAKDIAAKHGISPDQRFGYDEIDDQQF